MLQLIELSVELPDGRTSTRTFMGVSLATPSDWNALIKQGTLNEKIRSFKISPPTEPDNDELKALDEGLSEYMKEVYGED